MKKTSLVVIAGVTLASQLVVASGEIDGKSEADITAPIFTKAKYKYVKKPITADDGNFHGYVRMHHIFDDDDNTFAKTTGSTLGFGLGYGMEIVSGLRVGAEVYGVMDSGLTDTDEAAGNIAYGQFMNTIKNTDELDVGTAWGAHISYKKNGIKATIGRSQFKSPMTKIQITHVPNLYEFARLDGKILGGDASLAFITKMAYGSRSQTDFSFIGEKTGTAGMFLNGLTTSLTADPQIIRGDFYSIEDTLTAGTTNSSGILVGGYEKKIKRLNFKIWDFMVDDVANNLFVEGSYKFPLGKGKGLKLSAHVWNQNITNSNYEDKYGGTLIGAEATLKWSNIIGKFAYETKDEGGLLNAWGANPGYTSSIFSRNEYRSNVDAYKATLVYKPMKNLKLMVSYADYGQSDMTLGALASQTDATERDIAIIYHPRKDIMLKLFNANRTSEFSIADSRTQNHTRLIVNYAF